MVFACAKHWRSSRTFGFFEFFHIPPRYAVKNGDALSLAKTPYNELLSRTLGPFCITSFEPLTGTIDEHGNSNTILISRVTHVLSLEYLAHTLPSRMGQYCERKKLFAPNPSTICPTGVRIAPVVRTGMSPQNMVD